MTTTMSRGNTTTAEYLDNANQTKGRYFHESIAFGKSPAHSELYTILQACKAPNWDGYNALPVQGKTFQNAYIFIEALPLGYPLPSIGAEPDGHITLEWYHQPRWTLSVSISPEGILYYAALFGNSDVRGSDPFFGEIPKSILALIQRVHVA